MLPQLQHETAQHSHTGARARHPRAPRAQKAPERNKPRDTRKTARGRRAPMPHDQRDRAAGRGNERTRVRPADGRPGRPGQRRARSVRP